MLVCCCSLAVAILLLVLLIFLFVAVFVAVLLFVVCFVAAIAIAVDICVIVFSEIDNGTCDTRTYLHNTTYFNHLQQVL